MHSDPIDVTLDSIRPDRQLHYENYQVVSTVHALCGAITPNMVAISLKCVGPEVHLYFYLELESSVDRDEIEDVAAELFALQFTDVPIVTHVNVAGEQVQHSEIEGRPIYRRYEASTGA